MGLDSGHQVPQQPKKKKNLNKKSSKSQKVSSCNTVVQSVDDEIQMIFDHMRADKSE